MSYDGLNWSIIGLRIRLFIQRREAQDIYTQTDTHTQGHTQTDVERKTVVFTG